MKRYFYIIIFYFPLLGAVAPFKLGVENISESLFKKICPHKQNGSCMAGLITNQTGVDQKGVRTIDTLVKLGCPLRYIFAPEHGFTNVVAGKEVHDSVDKKTGVHIISLYGKGSGKMIAPEHMNNIDYLIFDIQDSGMRHYTYISTLLNTMKIAAEYDKPYIVLDRPNPLAGIMEGPLVDSDLISFISIAPIPLRHGMTIGELAGYFNKYICKKPVKLHVVKMKNYDRNCGFIGELKHQLSPNLQSLQSCYGYSFLGLLGEIEPFDVGVGTHMAFRCITLPEKLHVPHSVWDRLQTVLSSYGVQSFHYQHINAKNKKKRKGLRLEFSDINKLHAFELLITILQFFTKEKIKFSFSASFNKAVGTPKVQELIAGKISERLFFEHIHKDLQQFYQKARTLFLYEPLPTITCKTLITSG
ncbi:MAG TPA: DUF1343 domain-containing protein [Candidatus Babeliales bacterium]|jgi:uncharacterized protein YbbC (DUF1343 family)|nr:DUF1343 domain-containing protein [Candidatus Babeliales bacterium]